MCNSTKAQHGLSMKPERLLKRASLPRKYNLKKKALFIHHTLLRSYFFRRQTFFVSREAGTIGYEKATAKQFNIYAKRISATKRDMREKYKPRYIKVHKIIG